MRSLCPRKDEVRDLAPAESHSSGKLDFHIVRLLENRAKIQVNLLHFNSFDII